MGHLVAIKMIVLTALIGVLVIIVAGYLTHLAVWTIRALYITANIPAPKLLPILGNLRTFANVNTLEDVFVAGLHLYNTYMQSAVHIFKIWIGPKLVIGVGDPQHIEMVLTNDGAQQKDSFYRYAGQLFSGSVVRNGKEWEELRKLISPFHNRKRIESNLNHYHEKIVKLVNILETKVESDKEFDVKKYIAKCSTDIFAHHNYGCDTNEQERERKESLESVLERAIEYITRMIIGVPSCVSLTYAKMTKYGRLLDKAGAVYSDYINELLKIRKINKLSGDKDNNRSVYGDLLMEKAITENLSSAEIGRIGSDYLMAGSHSVSIMCSSMILLLAMHPDYQQIAYQEQLDILGHNAETEPTWEQLSQMTYLTRVFKEVIRLYTTPIIGRYITKDIDLGKYKIPSGSSVIILLFVLHRDPKLWSHPDDFYPDHFLPEESAKRPKNSYLPFSWGPRNCSGPLYALTICKLIVSALIRKYHFKTELKYQDLRYRYALFLEIGKGYKVKKILRN